jgi:4-amino-4-deoxy-L-arabinose transferase-like glycosyltransferase
MSALDVTTHLGPRPRVEPSGGRPPLPLVPIALALIVFGFVVLAAVVAYKTPAWQSSDEPEHVQNVENLVSGHWYGIDLDCKPKPSTVQLDSCNGDEAQQAPLYYLLMAGWQKIADLPPEVHPQLTQDVAFLQWLRFGNVLLGVGTVLTAFLAARVVARDRWTPLIAAALVAFFPGFLFLSAFVTNDNLVNLLGAILTYCALRFCRGGSTQWMLVTGGVFGLLVTTKLSVLPLALLIPVLALMAPTWRRRGWLLACGLLSALAVSGWYLIQNWVRYGDPLAHHASAVYLTRLNALGSEIWGIPIPYVVRNPLHLIFVNVPRTVVTKFWYESDWDVRHWSTGVGLVLTGVVAAVLLGLLRQRLSKRVLVALGALSVLSFSCVWFVAFQTNTYEPRYALVGLVALVTLVALAVQRWPVPVRWVLPAAAFVGCLVAVQQDVLSVHWT